MSKIPSDRQGPPHPGTTTDATKQPEEPTTGKDPRTRYKKTARPVTLLDRLGMGGKPRKPHLLGEFGGRKVSYALEQPSQRPVVIKRQPKSEKADREVALTGQTHSSRLVKGVEAWERTDRRGTLQSYLVTEHVGVPLDDHLGRTPPSEQQLKQLVGGTMQALQELHALGYAHRDVKWDNLRVHDGQVVLIDFGEAKPIDQAGVDKDVRDALLTFGTKVKSLPQREAIDKLFADILENKLSPAQVLELPWLKG